MFWMQRHLCHIFIFSLLITNAYTAHAHNPVDKMTVAADRFLDALNEKQRKLAVRDVSDKERKNWHYLPDKYIKPDGTRYGLTLKKMSAEQRLLAHALLKSGLSHKGYLKAKTIVSLEKVLHDLENQNPIRDPKLYYVTVFGKPGDKDAWGWRFEGHHLSVNFTIVDGHLISVTPSFFGSNPAIVKKGPRKGLWVLREEEQLARKLVKSLSDEQKKKALFRDIAPDDIVTSENRKVNKGLFTPAKGISCSDLNKKQREFLLQLIKAYAERFRPEIVNQINERTKLFDLKDVYFAWAGGMQKGQAHYYRVQTPQFLFEYDNTQNDANHVHAVWRDFDGDFGTDLLSKHYDEHHAK